MLIKMLHIQIQNFKEFSYSDGKVWSPVYKTFVNSERPEVRKPEINNTSYTWYYGLQPKRYKSLLLLSFFPLKLKGKHVSKKK